MDYKAGKYDVAVIGAGHAGCEAALAAARLGCRTIIFAINLDSIANMPCNPNIGGTAKGHLVREIDALGGEMGKIADITLIQSKTLNKSKGPAVYSLRAQIDRREYQRQMKNTLEKQPGLDIKQAEIVELFFENGKVTGLKTHTDAIYECGAIILSTGTFLKAKIIIGDISYSGGPDGLFPANRLSDSLRAQGITLLRFKTGTPPRLNRRSIDFSKMEEQPGDPVITPFSFETKSIEKEQISCWLTYTNEQTHKVIRDNLHRSPLYSGFIKGVGPRYCPSVEDKVVRFADRERHQVFIEPTGAQTQEVYLDGMSSSLPEDVQVEMVHTVAGLENAVSMKSAYAIEYDCLDPFQLKQSLELKSIDGLFAAGQINGSSGYEEAAAQGIIAGINAARKLKNLHPLILDRSQAYIGVLIDDLTTKGVTEPYRMMTSRAEYRLHLRQDNADMRLTKIGHDVGLISEERYENFLMKKKLVDEEVARLKTKSVSPSPEVNAFLEKMKSTPITTGVKLSALLKRSELSYECLKGIDPDRPQLDFFTSEQVEIRIKYEGYIQIQNRQIEQFKNLEKKQLPGDIKYTEIKGLRVEAKQKLERIRPDSIGQASRISGVTPADISVLLVYLEMAYGRKEK